jgi:hypothetical protein
MNGHPSVLEEGEPVPSNGLFYPSGFYSYIQVHRLGGFIHTLDDENNGMSWDCYPISDFWSSHRGLLILDLLIAPRSARLDSNRKAQRALILHKFVLKYDATTEWRVCWPTFFVHQIFQVQIGRAYLGATRLQEL